MRQRTQDFLSGIKMTNAYKIKKAFESYKKTGEVQILSEGTWDAPQTVKQARKLAQLMAAPLPVGVAADTIYSVVGDDQLFDNFYELEEKQGLNADARPLIAQTLHEWVSVLGTDEDPGWKGPWSKKAIEIINDAIKEFI